MCVYCIGLYSCVFLYSFIFSSLLCLVHDFHNKNAGSFILIQGADSFHVHAGKNACIFLTAPYTPYAPRMSTPLHIGRTPVALVLLSFCGTLQPQITSGNREYTGWPKKVSHYRESSLNRVKNRQPG